MTDLPSSFYQAEAAWLTPPDPVDAQVQLQGCLEFSELAALESIDTGDLDGISIVDAGFDPDADILRIWITGWLDCELDGEYDADRTGDLRALEVVDTDGVDFGPDPDEEYDSRDFGDE
mgnify:CR=1 FL=1